MISMWGDTVVVIRVLICVLTLCLSCLVYDVCPQKSVFNSSECYVLVAADCSRTTCSRI